MQTANVESKERLSTMVSDIATGLRLVVNVPDQMLPDPNVLDTYVFQMDRKLFLDDLVEMSAMGLAHLIMRYNMEDAGKLRQEREPITIYIMSYGGDIEEMWMLIDVIQTSVTPVRTVNLGQAASAAALIFLSGDERLMMPNAQVLLHQGSAMMSGDANKFLNAADNYRDAVSKMYDYIQQRTEIPTEEIRKYQKDDWYMDAKTCYEYGVCHRIVDDISQIL